MKIGLLLFKKVIGGVETVSITLAKLLQKQGHEVFFIFPFSDGDLNIRKINIPLQFKVYEYSYENCRVTVADTISFMTKTINYEKPDLIISMFLEESYILLKAKKNITKKFKLITMDHCGCCHEYKKFWKDRTFNIYNQSDALVTVTQIDRIFYKPHLNIPIVTINNLPQSDFYTEINPFDNHFRNKKILSLGRLVKNKGFDILIRAFSTIKQDGWTLHIYGDGPEKNNLEKLIKEEQIENKIFLYASTQNVPDVMNNHEIFIFPSLVESYGMVLLEALLMGLPSISFNCPNGPAIIEAQLPGSVILVPEKNEKLLSSEIENLINDDKRREQLTQLARKYRNLINEENNEYLWAELFKKIFNNK